jgi:hypothetical protein
MYQTIKAILSIITLLSSPHSRNQANLSILKKSRDRDNNCIVDNGSSNRNKPTPMVDCDREVATSASRSGSHSMVSITITLFRICISLDNVLTQLWFKLFKSHILRMSGNLDKKKISVRVYRSFRMWYFNNHWRRITFITCRSESIILALAFRW